MNDNSSGRLTPKQQELVKRLEKIRQNKEVIRQEAPKVEPIKVEPPKSINKSPRRNEEAQQRTRKAPPKENKFARPTAERKVPDDFSESLAAQRQRRQVPVPQAKRKAAVREKPKRYINQLSDGHSLAQAIVLSEILDKPVALRRR